MSKTDNRQTQSGSSSSQHVSEQTPLISAKQSEQRRSTTIAQPDKPGPLSFGKTLCFCWPYIVPHTPVLRFIGAMSVVSITAYKACLLVPGLSMKMAVDAINSDDPVTRTHVPIIAVLIFLLGRVGGAIFGQIQEVTQEYCSQHMARRFAISSFAHLQALSLSYHTHKKTGETRSILGRGIGSINTLLRLIVFSLFPTVVEALVVSTIFFKLGSPSIALTTVATVALYIFYTAYITTWRVHFGREVREAENNAWNRATETILHYPTVKSFGMDDEEVRRYDSLWSIVVRTAFKAKGMITAFDMSSRLIVQFGTCIGLLFAAYDAGHSTISAGDFVLVNAYIGQLFGPLLWLGKSYGEVVSALTNIEQVMQLFDMVPEVRDEPGAVDLSYDADQLDLGTFGDVEFRNVSFVYDAEEADHSGGVRDISFRVPAGKMVALVGPSGAGKSSVIRLLLRLYDVHMGQILVNGMDIRKVTQTSLRHSIGLVAQETVLFNDTLRNNVCYGRPTATEAEVWHAIQMASLDDFVKTQPFGLETVVGESGIRLSGGERQRVGIARAVIKQPAIMVLDESTSALSTIDERKIQRNLAAVCQKRTTIAVAHRLSTIMMADEILVFSNGCIVERGCHDDLVAKEGMYATMWKAQVGQE